MGYSDRAYCCEPWKRLRFQLLFIGAILKLNISVQKVMKWIPVSMLVTKELLWIGGFYVIDDWNEILTYTRAWSELRGGQCCEVRQELEEKVSKNQVKNHDAQTYYRKRVGNISNIRIFMPLDMMNIKSHQTQKILTDKWRESAFSTLSNILSNGSPEKGGSIKDKMIAYFVIRKVEFTWKCCQGT